MIKIIRLGLTPDSRSARENRMFPITGTFTGCLHGMLIQNRVYQLDGGFSKLSVLMNL